MLCKSNFLKNAVSRNIVEFKKTKATGLYELQGNLEIYYSNNQLIFSLKP